MHRFDQTLFRPVVPNCFAHGVYAGRHGAFRDDAAIPDFLDDLILGDDSGMFADKQTQEVKHLWFHWHDVLTFAQLGCGKVQDKVFEAESRVLFGAHRSTLGRPEIWCKNLKRILKTSQDRLKACRRTLWQGGVISNETPKATQP